MIRFLLFCRFEDGRRERAISCNPQRQCRQGIPARGQTDGYWGYDFLDHREGICHIGCWAHSRRKFMDVVKAQGKNHKTGSADIALKYIKELYRIEQEAKRLNYSPENVSWLI
ncbi:MAG TPA: hypothetical protein DDY32_17490 [Desulfobulbaceae bacterium]|nr:hypothetical protein [Desulfobulbaceae bacterium]